MPENDDDLFGDNRDEELDEFDRLANLLFEQISEFADDEEVPDDLMPLLLLRLSMTTRMMTYAMSVAKPSAAGLKLDLDRFRNDAEDLIRVMKKDADGFVAREGGNRCERTGERNERTGGIGNLSKLQQSS